MFQQYDDCRSQRGVTLVELMVSLVIGLVICLAVLAMLNGFESRKRNTTSVNDIDQAGNWALYTLDKWIRSAGSGFSQSDGLAYGCTLTAALSDTQILPRTASLPSPFDEVSTGTSNQFQLIPFLIVPDGTTPGVSGDESDVLVVMAGSSGSGETATMFDDVADTSELHVVSSVSFEADDLLLVVDLSSAATGSECLIEQTSSAFSFDSDEPEDMALAGDYYTSAINSVSLTAFTDTDNDAVLNLGNIENENPPNFLVIGVGDNNTLVGFDLLQSMNPVDSSGDQQPFPIADSVFELHALYGVDSDSDNIVDSWVEATGNYAPSSLTAGTSTSFSYIKTIKAVRIGLIMQTTLPDTERVSESSLTLFSGLDAEYDRSLSDDEQYYRYRTIEITIPVRNTLMLSTS